MINGAWGSGKTHFIKNYFKDIDHIYLSLYGLVNIGQVKNSILIDNFIGKEKLGSWGSLVTTKFLEFLNDKSLGSINEFPAFDINKVFIFDDLERCQLPIQEILGFINSLVEHNNAKVLLLANEEEITKSDNYRKYKEKLIGRSFALQANFEEPFDYFLSEIEKKYKKSAQSLKNNKSHIKKLFWASQLNNLRILRETMVDFSRLFEVMKEQYQKNTQAIEDLLCLFFALSFEYRAGNIASTDMVERFLKNLAIVRNTIDKKEEKSDYGKMYEKYKEIINLANSFISDEIIIETIEQGFYDPENINNALYASDYFKAEKDQPTWFKIWRYWEIEEDEFTPLFEKFNQEFQLPKHQKHEELLHIFGLRLGLYELFDPQKTRQDVVRECKTYIDKLYENDLLVLNLNEMDFSSYFDRYLDNTRGHLGLGYAEYESEEFGVIRVYLKDKIHQAVLDKIPQSKERFLNELKETPNIFANKLAHFSYLEDKEKEDSGKFLFLPILTAIKPAEFVDTFIKHKRPDQQKLFSALEKRYASDRLKGELTAEKDWIERVLKEMKKSSKKVSKFKKMILGHYCDGLKKIINPNKQ